MSELIETLTPAQEAKIPAYLEEYRQIGISTEVTNRDLAEKSILASYEYLKLEKPMILWGVLRPCLEPLVAVSLK